MKKIISIIAVSLVIGGGVYLFQKEAISPQKQLQQANSNLQEADSYTYIMEVDMESKKESEVKFRGEIDLDRKREAMEGDFNVELSKKMGAVQLGGTLTYVNDNLYGRLETAPLLLLPPDQIDTFTENHILLQEDVEKKTNQFLAEGMEEADMESITLQEVLDKTYKINDRLWKEAIVITNIEEDKLERGKAKKFTVQMDEKQSTEIILEFLQTQGLSNLLSEDRDGHFEEDLRKAMKEETGKFNIWIKDGYPVKSQVVMTENLSKQQLWEGAPQLQEEFPQEVTITVTSRFRNFNEDFDITEPEDFIKLEEVVQELSKNLGTLEQ